jgi:enoyl-CoA hydratase/carnithine racemase
MTTRDTDYSDIRYRVEERVAVVTLHRPDRLNAFTTTMARELQRAFAQADADDEVRAVIVTGAGRGFCAGADMSRGAATFDSTDDTRLRERAVLGRIGGVQRDAGGFVSLSIAACRKPVIGAINGPAIGIGVTMSLPMDVRIAAESGRFGFVFGKRGIVPEAASSWFLPRIVGISQATEWVLTGRIFDADEALRGRLVSRVVPDDDLFSVAYSLARDIADNTSPISAAVTRQLMWSMLGAASPWDAHRLDSSALAALGQGPDAAEGVRAFLEKRPADFPGRVGSDYPDAVPAWPAAPDDLESGPPA